VRPSAPSRARGQPIGRYRPPCMARDLWNLTEIGRYLNVSTERARQVANTNPTFPAPATDQAPPLESRRGRAVGRAPVVEHATVEEATALADRDRRHGVREHHHVDSVLLRTFRRTSRCLALYRPQGHSYPDRATKPTSESASLGKVSKRELTADRTIFLARRGAPTISAAKDQPAERWAFVVD
jgi:hypothetical protein